MRLTVTLRAPATGKSTTVRARPSSGLTAGTWVISERARRAAFRRIGVETDPGANPTIETTATIRAIDADGWHTYTLWS